MSMAPSNEKSKAIHDTLITCGQPAADIPGEIALLWHSVSVLECQIAKMQNADEYMADLREIKHLLARSELLMEQLVKSLPRG